jgi:hypothetical protein
MLDIGDEITEIIVIIGLSERIYKTLEAWERVLCLMPYLSSESGIHMQSIEPTEARFVPHYPIELSKGGKMPENRCLFDPNKPLRSPRRLSRSSGRRTSVAVVQNTYSNAASAGKNLRNESTTGVYGHTKTRTVLFVMDTRST